jgi:hypothetical protein
MNFFIIPFDISASGLQRYHLFFIIYKLFFIFFFPFFYYAVNVRVGGLEGMGWGLEDGSGRLEVGCAIRVRDSNVKPTARRNDKART